MCIGGPLRGDPARRSCATSLLFSLQNAILPGSAGATIEAVNESERQRPIRPNSARQRLQGPTPRASGNFQGADILGGTVTVQISHLERRVTMKLTRPSTTIGARWLLILSLITVPSLAWRQKNKGSAPAPASHPSAPASHPSGGSTGGSHPSGGGASTANHGTTTTANHSTTTTANHGTTTTTANHGTTTTTANKGATTTANKGTTTTTANKGTTTTTANKGTTTTTAGKGTTTTTAGKGATTTAGKGATTTTAGKGATTTAGAKGTTAAGGKGATNTAGKGGAAHAAFDDTATTESGNTARVSNGHVTSIHTAHGATITRGAHGSTRVVSER